MQNLTLENAIAVPKRKSGTLLPILVVLFLVSYGLMAMLVVEQGQTIESQRSLIHQILGDSLELTAMKGRELQRQRAAGQTQAKPGAQPHVKDPSSQIETPSLQDAPRQNMKNAPGAGQLQKQAPQKLPKNAADATDIRRAMKQI